MNAITEITNFDHTMESLARIHDTPNLTALSYALRHPETWPPNFVWDYKITDRCALGLAAQLWPKTPDPNAIPSMAGMTYEEGNRVFMYGKLSEKEWCNLSMEDKATHCAEMTPHDVADRIDAYLAEQA